MICERSVVLTRPPLPWHEREAARLRRNGPRMLSRPDGSGVKNCKTQSSEGTYLVSSSATDELVRDLGLVLFRGGIVVLKRDQLRYTQR
jgi:hypothetical protein